MALEANFSNHIYQCQNSLYRQSKGGGIGARITGEVARVVMDLWMDLIKTNLEENGITIYLLTKYVDDINIASSLIPKGEEWFKEGNKWRLRRTDRMEEEDSNRTEELATIEKIRWLGNRLVPGLKLTIDLPELHTSKKCPMLDIQVWTETRPSGAPHQ